MNRLGAFIVALAVTLVIGLGMLVVGVNAVFNPSSVEASDSPGPAPALQNPTGNATVDQLNALIQQYRAREKQYQDRESQYQAQLDQATQQIQQLQGVLEQLQERGVISIGADGTIQLRRGRGEGGFVPRGGSDDSNPFENQQ